jgi:YVTN family beta-propeller protein
MEGNAVTFVDLANGKPVQTIDKLAGARHISYNRQQTKAYVTLSGSNEVAVIDTQTRQAVERIKVGAVPHGIQIKALPGIGGSC